MCSSDVMLRISSSVSSGLSRGPSTRCKMPCTRITGGTPTRTCRSDAPSDTTNCSKSDIEYDIKLFLVAHRRADDFLGRRQAGENLADTVFAQGPHAHLARPRPQDRGRRPVVNEFARLVIDDKNLKDAEPPAVARVVAIVAAEAFQERRPLQHVRRHAEGAHF